MDNSILDAVMTVKEVSDYLKVGESTVYRLVNEGKLPGRKIGGMWRFSRRTIEEMLDQQDFLLPQIDPET